MKIIFICFIGLLAVTEEATRQWLVDQNAQFTKVAVKTRSRKFDTHATLICLV
jgi:hypothetical protein